MPQNNGPRTKLGYDTRSQKKNPKRFDIPSGCSIDGLKDVIKPVAPQGISPYGIHESQVVRRLFFDSQVIMSIHKKLSNLK